jgi:hypothetical protein
MKSISPLFTGSCLLWMMIRISREMHHPVPWLNGQLTDILAVPVIGYICLSFMRNFIFKSNSYVFPAGYTLFITLYLSCVFEILLPLHSSRFTSDWKDVIAYFAGSLLFHQLMNKPSYHI